MTRTRQRGAFEGRISPELALVDPELAAAARNLLPDPGDLWPLYRAEPVVSAAARASEQSAPPKLVGNPSLRKPTRRHRLVAIVAAGVAAVAVGTLGLVQAAGHRAADATLTAVHTQPSGLRAQAARQAREARTYTWTAVPGAAAYEFEILRGENAVFQTTTTDLAVELPVRLRLSPGRYTWSVTPTFENQSTVLLRRPVVEATFQVATT